MMRAAAIPQSVHLLSLKAGVSGPLPSLIYKQHMCDNLEHLQPINLHHLSINIGTPALSSKQPALM